MSLALADSLQKCAWVVYPVVDSIDDGILRLRFPNIREMAPSSGQISLNVLQPAGELWHKSLHA